MYLLDHEREEEEDDEEEQIGILGSPIRWMTRRYPYTFIGIIFASKFILGFFVGYKFREFQEMMLSPEDFERLHDNLEQTVQAINNCNSIEADLQSQIDALVEQKELLTTKLDNLLQRVSNLEEENREFRKKIENYGNAIAFAKGEPSDLRDKDKLIKVHQDLGNNKVKLDNEINR